MGIDMSARSRAVGVETAYKNYQAGKVQFLPMKIAVIGQGNTAKTYATTPKEITSSGQAAQIFGYGSPLHLAIRELFPDSGSGVGSIPVTAYPLVDASGAVAAAGAIGATGTQTAGKTYVIKIAGISTAEISVPKDATAAEALALFKTAIDSVLNMPITTGTIADGSLPITAKWKGASGNDILIEVVGDTAGITFSVTAMASGATNPDVDDALDLIGTKWETLIINCLNYDDTASLVKYFNFGDGRWDDLVHTPCVVFSGTADDYATRSIKTDAYKLDRVNALIPVVGSNNLPCVIASAAVAKIAKVANNNPARNYQDYLTTINAGSDSVQENYNTRNLSVSKGSGNTVLDNDYVRLNDTITFYHPEDEGLNPGFRYVCDVIKLMNVIYNIYLIQNSAEWKGAPLIPNGTTSNNAEAKKPRDMVTALSNLAASLADNAILAEADYTQENLSAVISSQNPKRLDVVFPCKLSGNVEIISTVINFGFYFGGE